MKCEFDFCIGVHINEYEFLKVIIESPGNTYACVKILVNYADILTEFFIFMFKILVYSVDRILSISHIQFEFLNFGPGLDYCKYLSADLQRFEKGKRKL